ncbi:uncharacterized protein [Anser cygnoides]|uniref:uncharacterized protein n=1 Tax=Anser cygnoides TaxID=8845 RepID=UPI0034D25A3C
MDLSKKIFRQTKEDSLEQHPTYHSSFNRAVDALDTTDRNILCAVHSQNCRGWKRDLQVQPPCQSRFSRAGCPGLFYQFVAQSWEELVTKHPEWNLCCTPALCPGRPEDLCFFRGTALCVTVLRDLLLFSVHCHAGRGFVFKHLLGSLLVLRPRHPCPAWPSEGSSCCPGTAAQRKSSALLSTACLGLRAEEMTPRGGGGGGGGGRWERGTGGGKRGHRAVNPARW